MELAIALFSAFLALGVFVILNIFVLRPSKTVAFPGLQKLSAPTASNLADQYEKKYSYGHDIGKDSKNRAQVTVKALFVFPIKSCGGLELSKGHVISSGVKYDRLFSFARFREANLDAADERFRESRWEIMTQRDFPKLVNVKPEVWIPDPASLTYSPDNVYVKSQGCVTVSFPTTSNLEKIGLTKMSRIIPAMPRPTTTLNTFLLPLLPSAEQIKHGNLQRRPMRIWKDKPEAIDLGSVIPAAAYEELRAYLGVKEPFTLFRVDPAKPRQVFRNAPSKETLGYQSIQSFQDRVIQSAFPTSSYARLTQSQYPLHLNNLASIHDVSQRLPPTFGPLSALRFRSNIYGKPPARYSQASHH